MQTASEVGAPPSGFLLGFVIRMRATASVQLVIFCKLLELSAVTHKKEKTSIPAGTEQEPDATEKVTRERDLSVFAGIGNIA